MTKTVVSLPCTAQKLETALHSVCDHDGTWDSEVVLLPPTSDSPARIALAVNGNRPSERK